MTKVSERQINHMRGRLRSAASLPLNKLYAERRQARNKFHEAAKKEIASYFKANPQALAKAAKNFSFELYDSSEVFTVNAEMRMPAPVALQRKLKQLRTAYQKQDRELENKTAQIENEINDFLTMCVLHDLPAVRDKFEELINKLKQ